MRQSQDLIERVAAADPLPDAEHLSTNDEREADELLAALLATPVKTRTAPRPRIRRRAVLAAGLACAAAAAFAALDLLDSDAPGTDVVEQAVAAVTRADSVYHVVQRVRAVPGAPESEQPVYGELWHSSDGRVHGKAFATADGQRGKLLAEFAGRRRPGRTSGWGLEYDARENTISRSRFGRAPDAGAVPELDPFADPSAGLRQLERQGALRPAGTTRFAGRRAFRLEAPSTTRWRSFAFERVEYLVDAKTYLPLALQVAARVDSGETFRMFTRYLVYERLPLDERSLGQLDLDPHPGAKCAAGAGELRGDRALGFPNPCPRVR